MDPKTRPKKLTQVMASSHVVYEAACLLLRPYSVHD